MHSATAIEVRFIATAESQDVALTLAEKSKLLLSIYQSLIKRSHKLALLLAKFRLGLLWEPLLNET